MRPRTTRLLLAILLLVTSGCETASTGPVQGTPLEAEWVIPEAGITLSPPGQNTALISADNAFDLCRKHVADCDQGSPTSVQLALMADTSSNIVAKGTLVWVFSWLGSNSCLSFNNGNAGASSDLEATPVLTPTVCDKLAFVDARTDTYYFTNEVLRH